MTEEDMDLSRLKGKPHLRGIYLSGFKGAPHSGVSVPLRPLTIVYGPNSGGKSTILKALSSISQTRHRNSLFAVKDYWTSSGIWFDLGAPGQVLHRGKPTKNTFTIGFEFEDISTRFPWIDSNGTRIARPNAPLSPVAHNVMLIEDLIGAPGPVVSHYVSRFELPEKLPKNHFLLFSPTRSAPNSIAQRFVGSSEIPIYMGEKSDINLEDLKEITNYDGEKQYSGDPNVKIHGVESVVEDGRNYVDVKYSLSDGNMTTDDLTEPVLWAFKALRLNGRIDLRFRPDGVYDLDGIEYHEKRNGEYHKILSLNKGILKRERAYFIRHHNAPSITDPGSITEHEEWGEEDLKVAQTMARLILPIKYKVEVSPAENDPGEGDETLLLSCKHRSGKEERLGWWHSEFHEMIRAIEDTSDDSDDEDEHQRQDSVIEGINRLCGKYGFRGMSNKEKVALRKFLNPTVRLNSGREFSPDNSLSRKKPVYQLNMLYNSVQPKMTDRSASEEFLGQLSKREVEDGAHHEFGTRSEIIRLFGVNSSFLKPYIQIDENLTMGGASRRDPRRGGPPTSKWGSLPTNSRYHFIRLYWSTVQYIEEIVEHMSRVDYLSASRLSPERVYSSIEVARAGVMGERSIANLFGRFPPNSSKLKALNDKMEEVVGMRVKFSELMGPYKQGTGLIDVRVGRPGKRKVAQLPDVGFGVSQTLPVLAALAEADFSPSGLGPMLVIEEAESNLHPAAQARLMRVILQDLPLVEGPSIVMETHSEHFLKTILSYLSEEGDLTDDDVAIVYVDEDETGMFAVHMETRNGEFLHPWPRRGRWDDPTSPII